MTVRKETGNDAKSKKILFKQNITFSLGVTRIEDLPKETSAEVAFFGRSNVGKSSLLNSITDKNKLAYTSKNPGRTRELNFFLFSTFVIITYTHRQNIIRLKNKTEDKIKL